LCIVVLILAFWDSKASTLIWLLMMAWRFVYRCIDFPMGSGTSMKNLYFIRSHSCPTHDQNKCQEVWSVEGATLLNHISTTTELQDWALVVSKINIDYAYIATPSICYQLLHHVLVHYSKLRSRSYLLILFTRTRPSRRLFGAIRSTSYERPRKRSLYCSSDFGRSQETQRTSQPDELHNSDTLSTEVQRDDMSPRPAPSPSADSLYTLPSPRTIHRVAQFGPVSHDTSLCDVPPLSLNDANDLEAHRRMRTSANTQQTILPPPPHPSSHRYHTNQRPAVPTPSPDPLPRGSLRVANRDLSPLIVSSSTQTAGHSSTRLKETSTRAKVDFTDPFAGKYEQPKVGLQAQSSEKRKINADLHGVTQKLETGFKAIQGQNKQGSLLTTYNSWCIVHCLYDTCLSEAQKREGSKYLSSQPSIVNGQSAPAKPPVFSDIPPPGRVWAETIRLPDCYSCTNNWGTRHLHDIEDEHYHQETLKIPAIYQAAKQKAEEELQRRSRRQKQSRSWWPGSAGRAPVMVRSLMTNPMEDIQTARREPPMPVSAVLQLYWTSHCVLTASRFCQRLRRLILMASPTRLSFDPLQIW
jgi:hypothetical protein